MDLQLVFFDTFLSRRWLRHFQDAINPVCCPQIFGTRPTVTLVTLCTWDTHRSALELWKLCGCANYWQRAPIKPDRRLAYGTSLLHRIRSD
jgi:hypothetical protein